MFKMRRPFILSIFLILCIVQINACTPALPIDGSNPPSSERELPLPSPKQLKPKVVLVLGSGAARGFAHAGVLKVLEENHVPIDMIIGTSAGSIVGALYADNPSSSALINLFLTTKRNEVINFSLMNMGRGLFKGEQLQKFLIKNMKANSFHQLAIPFFAVATDLKTGEPHVFGSGAVAPAVNASSAIPPFFSPVPLFGKDYVDGGFVNPVAVDVASRFHPKIIIAVSLDAPLSNKLPTSNPGIFLRSLELMSRKLNQYSLAKADVVISPKPVEEGMFDGSKRQEQIDAGAKAARDALPRIKQLLLEYNIR
jgi:NTE family protein